MMTNLALQALLDETEELIRALPLSASHRIELMGMARECHLHHNELGLRRMLRQLEAISSAISESCLEMGSLGDGSGVEGRRVPLSELASASLEDRP